MPKRLFLLFIFTFVFIFAVFAEENNKRGREDIWIGISADTAFYSVVGLAYGGGFVLGYGTGSAIGLKATWLIDQDGIDTLELGFLLRFYFFGMNAHSGPFIQFVGGTSLFNRSGNFSVPSYSGNISAGLCLGWRFIVSNRWFIEPSVRGGYPYLYGASISAGIRF